MFDINFWKKMKPNVLVIAVLLLLYEGCAATKEGSDAAKIWFDELNNDMKVINQYTAYYAWELSVAPNKALLAASVEFNAAKSKWLDTKCRELDHFLNPNTARNPEHVVFNNTMPEKVATILCSGPKFTESESIALTKILYEMQEAFTETKVCLPKHFDVCANIDWLFHFTYEEDKNGHVQQVDLSQVLPTGYDLCRTPLNFYNGNVSEDYYVFGGHSGGIVATDSNSIESQIRTGPMLCFNGEPDLEKMMKGDFRPLERPDCALKFNWIFRWAWESWRMVVGNRIGLIYPSAVSIMNAGARGKGFSDIGEIWRHEIELPNLQRIVRKLNKDIKPFYQLLHGVMRDALWDRVHTFEAFDRVGTIPAHLLGSMWSQNWEIYQPLLMPFSPVNLDKNLMDTNWTSLDMVKRADDFYSSLGLPPMPVEFWTKSNFQQNGNSGKCHGTAANMFNGNDYRMIVCAESTWEDFYVIIHELGHLHYYMAYNQQPIIYQDANSALQESIGDALFLGFMTPQNLNRLRLLPDDQLYTKPPQPEAPKGRDCSKKSSNITALGKPYPNISCRNRQRQSIPRITTSYFNEFDLSFLLKMALTKIPQIPFEFILDEFRWALFSGNVSMGNANDYFWLLALSEQGIHPPDWELRSRFFDPGAKYHVADNTPYVRYFLASFIQAQIFRGLCEVTVFGHVNPVEPLPMPLHRCDIYGSKRAGKLLKKALSIGAEQHWTESLFILTGSRDVSSDALLLYYKPLIGWLQRQTIERQIRTGW